MMNDSVETENETGGWHRGRPVLRTMSEDEDHIAFNSEHVEHDMSDGPNENEKTEAESKIIESTSMETTWRQQERQVKNIVIEAQRTKKQIAPWVKVTTRGASSSSKRDLRRNQRKTWKSEDSSRRGQVHPKKRNNDWKKWANAWKNVSETRKDWNDSKTSKEFSKTSKVSETSQE